MPKSFHESITTTLQEERRQAGISQQDLATAVQVSRQTIIAIEKGNYAPTIILAMKLARYFNKTVEDIFSYES